MKIPTFCTVTSLLGIALSSNSSLEATRFQQAFQEHTGVVCVPDLLAEGAVIGSEAYAEQAAVPPRDEAADATDREQPVEQGQDVAVDGAF